MMYDTFQASFKVRTYVRTYTIVCIDLLHVECTNITSLLNLQRVFYSPLRCHQLLLHTLACSEVFALRVVCVPLDMLVFLKSVSLSMQKQ